MAQETQTGPLYQPRGVRWGEKWEGGSKGRGCIHTYAHEGQYDLLSLPIYRGIPSKNTLTETPGIIFGQMVQLSQHIIMKLTITDFK